MRRSPTPLEQKRTVLVRTLGASALALIPCLLLVRSFGTFEDMVPFSLTADPPRLKVLVYSVITPEIMWWGNESLANHMVYSQMHGYDYKLYDQNLFDDRDTTWSKLRIVQLELPKYDVVLSMDADAIFTNLTWSVESIIEEALESANATTPQLSAEFPSLVACKDWYDSIRFNAGVLIFRNTSFTYWLVNKTMCEVGSDVLPWNWLRSHAHEQTTINWQIDKINDKVLLGWEKPKRLPTDPDPQVIVYSRNRCNAHPDYHKFGDWILHAAGKDHDWRGKRFTEENRRMGITAVPGKPTIGPNSKHYHKMCGMPSDTYKPFS